MIMGKNSTLNSKVLEETINYLKLIAERIQASIRVVRIYKNNVCTVRIKLCPIRLKNIEDGIL